MSAVSFDIAGHAEIAKRFPKQVRRKAKDSSWKAPALALMLIGSMAIVLRPDIGSAPDAVNMAPLPGAKVPALRHGAMLQAALSGRSAVAIATNVAELGIGQGGLGDYIQTTEQSSAVGVSQ